MRNSWILILGLSLPVLGGGAGGPSSSPDPLELNRLLLEKYRYSNTKHYYRLKRDLEAFWNLPPKRQQQLRNLDRDFHQLDPQEKDRLQRVLMRYYAWYTRLPEKDQQHLDEAANWEQRLQRVKKLRYQQWLLTLPLKVQEELKGLKGKKKQMRINRLRKEQENQKRVWTRTLRFRPLPK
jgi:hypothetical protein